MKLVRVAPMDTLGACFFYAQMLVKGGSIGVGEGHACCYDVSCQLAVLRSTLLERTTDDGFHAIDVGLFGSRGH